MSEKTTTVMEELTAVIKMCSLPPLDKMPSLREKLVKGEIFGMRFVINYKGVKKWGYAFDLGHHCYSITREEHDYKVYQLKSVIYKYDMINKHDGEC